MAADDRVGNEESPSNILLIGYRGTGKTTVARILAARLGWSCVDADAVLEERHGRSIRCIFEEEGEARFREKEAATLVELSRCRNQVIATGGGVVLRESNRKILRQAGRVVWLNAEAPILWERLQSDSTTRERRPPLAGGGLAEIETLLAVRRPLYESCADFIVDTTGRSADAVADQIMELLRRPLTLPSPTGQGERVG